MLTNVEQLLLSKLWILFHNTWYKILHSFCCPNRNIYSVRIHLALEGYVVALHIVTCS